MNSSRREVPESIVRELLTLPDRSPIIRAAFDALCMGVLTDQLDFELPDPSMEITQTMREVIVKHWSTLGPQICLHAFALNLVPYRIASRPVVSENDPVRAATYGKDATKIVWDDVPVIPHFKTYRLFVDLNADGEVVYSAESLTDKAPVYVAVTRQHGGPFYDSNAVSSAFGVLLERHRILVGLERMARHSQIAAACPTIFVEHTPETATQADNAANQRKTADEIADITSSNVYQINDEKVQMTRSRDIKVLMEAIENGECVDPAEITAFLPRNCRLASQPVMPQIDLTNERARFDTLVAAVMKVPESFLSSSKQGGTLTGSQSMIASSNDEARQKQGRDALQTQLIYVLAQMAGVIFGKTVQVRIPVVSHATPEVLTLLYHANVIDAQTFREHAARAAGIHSDHVVKKGKLELPPRVDKADMKPAE